MRSGRKRHLVTLQAPIGNAPPDTYASGKPAYENRDDVWAGVEPLNGRELYRAQQVNNQIKIRVVLDYYPGLTGAWRVIHEGRVLDIVEGPIDPDERHIDMFLMCRESTDM